MADDIILDVKNLNTSFFVDGKEVHIIKNVSLQAKRGKTLALVGESGCGKSVTMHSIVRMMPKNARVKSDYVLYRSLKGNIKKEYRLDLMSNYGKDMRRLRGTEISMIFQDPMAALNPVYRVGSQVMEGLLEHNPKMKKKDAQTAVIEMFEKLGIPDPVRRINDFPHQLSGGMKQRIIIAVAMICNPELIIADEPTTALDVTIQAQIMELMKKLQTEFNKTVIMITHNMGLVAETADDVAVMYMGRIVERGSVSDIFSAPMHPYTQALFKSVPVLGVKDGKELTTIAGSTPDPATLGPGCEFADRCPFCTHACTEAEIPSIYISGSHEVRCLKAAKNG